MDLEVALDKLEGLGSPDAIAKFFEAEGIKGIMRFGESCPIAKYLIRETRNEYIGVGHRYVTTTRDHSQFDHMIDNTPVQHFVENFDRCQYPNLDEEV